MNALLNWAIFIALGGAAYWYYSHQNSSRGRHQRGRTTQRATTTTGTGKADLQWLEGDGKPTAKAAKVAKTARKSVKKAVQDVGEKAKATLSAASSTTGADADDDLSPALSPALGATTAPSGRDVSDMLESSAPAPSVLRLTPSEKPTKASKPQPQRVESTQETKKQRQNREKKEREKIQRAEDEKQRKALEEKQRRTARISRGEPAKNGIPVPQAPTSNPWSGNRSTNGTSAPAVQSSGQLLDTFEPDVVSTASSSENATNGTAPTPDSLSGSYSYASLPPEEEQMKIFMEQDSAWTTVSKGKKQKKNKAESATGDESSDSGAPHDAAPAPPVKQAPTKKPENIRSRSGFEVLSEPTPNVGHPQDSTWTVA